MAPLSLLWLRLPPPPRFPQLPQQMSRGFFSHTGSNYTY